MPDMPCPVCRIPVDPHFVVRADCRVRWRGNSFDAYEAQAYLGVAVSEAMGFEAASKADRDRFAEEVIVKADRASTDLNPEATFDPAEGEAWAFHVGFRKPVDADTLARCREAAVGAVNRARNFRNATIA